MKRDFSQVIFSYNGKPYLPPISGERFMKALSTLDAEIRLEVEAALTKAGIEPLTFAEACAGALVQSSEKLALKTKTRLERLRLAERLFADGAVEITPDERDDIKVMVDRAYSDAIVPGRVFEMLEGE